MKIISPIKSNTLDLPNELQIELSVIESGLIVAEVESSVVFVIKDPEQTIENLSDLHSVLLNFTKIVRPEFPTINVELKLQTTGGISLKYDYFFNSDSEYELNLLHSALYQTHINLYFLSGTSELCIKAEMEGTETEQLRNCLQE